MRRGGGGTSLKAINREVHEALSSGSVDIARKLVQRCLETEDDRVLAVIGMGILDKVQGKATDRPQSFGDAGAGVLDLSVLTPEEQQKTLDACAWIRWVQAEVPRRMAGIETQETER